MVAMPIWVTEWDGLAAALPVPAWHADALCREHPDVNFFPERGEPSAPAKAICRACLVQRDCLAAELDIGYPSVGIFGGTSPRDRRRLRAAGITGDDVLRHGVYAVEGSAREADLLDALFDDE